MSVAEGERFGPYEILGRIGAGGMGEVYRARDTRLDRTVALKVLPAELAGDPALRSRFEREARSISALAHHHICTLFDVGEQDGRMFLVMEHLEGQTLLERLRKGALPIVPLLEIATQVTDALAAAHKLGIVHRDLKPGNVMLTKSGAKLLDFGLARLTAAGERPVVEGLTSVPTESVPLTGRGTLLGTLPYMAPEQLEGKPADARTDLWALGLLIYEMVTGRRAFEGRSHVSLVGAILEREPEPLRGLQPLAPPALERLVKRCLAKSPDDRWDTAHDVADELRWIAETATARAESSRQRPGWTWTLGALALSIVGILVGILVDRWFRPLETLGPAVVHSLIDIGPAEELNAGGVSPLTIRTVGGSRTALDWTPDGRALVFVGRRGGVQQLYLRDLGRDEARPMAGTEGAQVPVVSTDGRWVAFWADRAIRRTPIAGGPASVLVPERPAPPHGIAWDTSGRLYYHGPENRIWRVAPEGAPEPVTVRGETELSHSLPHLTPGDKTLLFTVRRQGWTWGDEEVVAQDRATGERKTLLRDAVDARYVRGHLVFLRRGVLMAVSFDLERLTLRGEPGPVLEDVGQALTSGNSGDVTGAGQFAVTATGTLAYLAGAVQPYPTRTLVAVDRQGRVSPLAAAARSYGPTLDLAPDGRRLAVITREIRQAALWVVDTSRGTLAQLAGSGDRDWPRWKPDGQRIAFTRNVKGVPEVVWQPADGIAPAETLVRGGHIPSSWSPDGRHLASVLGGDIWITTLNESTPTLRRVTETPEIEGWPEFSPDGKWLAYGSNTTGRDEVYVQPWPGPGPREQVSLDGGTNPVWDRGGRELFYLSLLDPAGRGRMMTVDVQKSPRLRIGTPRPLFEFSATDLTLRCLPARCFAVSADGVRFFVTQLQPLPPTPPVTHIRLVQGWLEEAVARLGGEAPR